MTGSHRKNGPLRMSKDINLTMVLCILMILDLHFLQAQSNEGMIHVQGGIFKTTDKKTGQQTNIMIHAFYMDQDVVSVEEFEAFVEATQYKTDAERFGSSAVFDLERQDWILMDGANFRFPNGKNKAKANPKHPVTHVSWNDAMSYARWKGGRLPTEAEWEYAARNAGTSNDPYAWGRDLVVNGTYKANTWQGRFPFYNTCADGYATTSPVGLFGRNALGLSDMGGNVWQWCSDEIVSPDSGDIAPEIHKVMKGGSFLCDPKVCHGYKISERSSASPESGLSNTGFRCVRTVEK